MADISERVLLVEDAPALREVLQTVLEHEGYQVSACSSAEEAIKAISSNTFSLVLSDFKLPGQNGIDLLKLARQNSSSLPFLMMTAYGSVDIAVEAMKQGANDFISKPFEPKQLCRVIRDMIQHRRVLDRTLGKSSRRLRSFITQDPATLEMLEQARKAATFPISVLILGDSGTGKELVARYIHEHSHRADKPFVSVNCAAMPAELLESEFFGHEAGAFTGATQDRIGLFEVASEGTIFLDEIGEMPPELQVKLLRVLQSGEVKRVGGTKTIKVQPRILAATNKDIETAIKDKTIREDLFYRLAVLTLTLPALKERTLDIELLSQYFIESFALESGRHAPTLSNEAKELMLAYHWPGNVRELENVIERAMVLAGDKIEISDLGINLNSDSNLELVSSPLGGLDFEAINGALESLPQITARATKQAEVVAIKEVLAKTKGNKSKAAELLGISYKTLLNKVRDYEL